MYMINANMNSILLQLRYDLFAISINALNQIAFNDFEQFCLSISS